MVHTDGTFTSIEKTIYPLSVKANLFTFAGVECCRRMYVEALDQYDGNFSDDITPMDKS